jgi:hypothetical protein
MTKNPILNAIAASAYIVAIALVMNWGTRFAPKGPTLMAPIAVISLFTLSAAVMGYLFCYQPIQLYFDGKKKPAVNLFLQTVAVFAILTLITLTLLFSGVIR